MTQEEILDYNKRCAEFLGMYDYSKDNEYFEKGNYYCYSEKEKNPGSGYYTIIQNTSDGYYGIFNSDWNWIMKMVEAIEKNKYLLDKERPYYLTIDNNYCGIFFHRWNDNGKDFGGTKQIVSIKANSKKEAVVQAINQFLIWNKNNNSL